MDICKMCHGAQAVEDGLCVMCQVTHPKEIFLEVKPEEKEEAVSFQALRGELSWDRDTILAFLSRLVLSLGWETGVARRTKEGGVDWTPTSLRVVSPDGKEEVSIEVSLCDVGICSPLVIHKGYVRNHTTDEYLHVQIAKRMFGGIPDGYTVDHIDRNPLNNTRQNLRLATKRGQMLNRAFEGKGYELHGSRYRAYASIGGKKKIIGTFEKEEDAYTAYQTYKEAILEAANTDGTYILPSQLSNSGLYSSLYMKLPNGQVSWLIQESNMDLSEFLPNYPDKWDGHSYEEKRRRLLSWRMVFLNNLDLPPLSNWTPCGKCGWDGIKTSVYCAGVDE